MKRKIATATLATLPTIADFSPTMTERLRLDDPPQTRLDWALWWAQRGMVLFPCEVWLGTPLGPRWYSTATTDRQTIVGWWSAHPDADMAVVPEHSGHFVIVAHGGLGKSSLFDLQEDEELQPDFAYRTRWNDLHLWLKGESPSRKEFAAGLDIVGAGRFLYLPPSAAPDPVLA
jgi:hypothetical protein